MNPSSLDHLVSSRRGFLRSAAGVTAGSLLVPSGWGHAAKAGAPSANDAYRAALESSTTGRATYQRVSLTDPQAPLKSYAKAVNAMLKLPYSDPRNWYRNAFIHLMDCPHGNWWLLPWHRAYIGWFEQTCRELSGDANFALPYWDWTADASIPLSMFDGVLTPTGAAYASDFADFKKQAEPAVAAFWSTLDAAQIAELKKRNGFSSASLDQLWSAVESAFFDRSKARALTSANRGFDPVTTKAVSPATLRSALAAQDFIDFGSPISPTHSVIKGFGILEGQPHNNVHNNVGGFMEDFLSPVDPIFFLHHANIDRLWDVWTRKQLKQGKPTLPTDARELARWKAEPFLFYINRKGERVVENKAGDYAEIGQFDYSYTRGSGEAFQFRDHERSSQMWRSTIHDANTTPHSAATSLMLPSEFLESASAVEAEGRPGVFATVTLPPGTELDGVRFDVLVNPPQGLAKIDFDDPSFAGSFTHFGSSGGHGDAPIRFTIALDESISRLRQQNRLSASEPLRIQVVADRKGVSLTPLVLKVEDLTVGTF